MTGDEFENPYLVAVSNILGIPRIRLRISDVLKFDAMLGIDAYLTFRGHADKPLDVETLRLLNALTGPHGKALAKAYRIQKGLE